MKSTALSNNKSLKAFLEKNYHQYTNQELATMLNLKLSMLRTICYALGFKRMEMEYFMPVQEKFLRAHFAKTGDTELAEIFQRKWPKQKGWTKKQIEKKRKYLGLKRTPGEIKIIHQKNVAKGRFASCPVKAWDKRGRAGEGTIRYWTTNTGKKIPVIKHEGRFIHWCRWAWQTYYGKIPAKMNVVFKDGDPYNLNPQNLFLLSNGELSRLNSKKSSQGLSDNYIAAMLSYRDSELRNYVKADKTMIEMKRKQIILNRTIYEHKYIKKQT